MAFTTMTCPDIPPSIRVIWT